MPPASGFHHSIPNLSDRKSAARRVAVAMGATGVIAIAAAVPIRGVTDARPARLVPAVNAPTRVWSGREQELEEKPKLLIRFQPF
jgi:hypothetical protein